MGARSPLSGLPSRSVSTSYALRCPRVLALRPLLVGVQIAVGGVLAGVGAGWLLGAVMRRELATLLPLPIWRTPFQTGRFVEGAALGLAIPLVATALPLRRVLRLQPVDAIRTGSFGTAGRGTRLTRVLRDVRLPGRSYLSMPLRNVLRAPRRTGLTALGVAAAITCLVAVLGLFDTFTATGDRSAAELDRTHPERLDVTLTALVARDAPLVRGIAATPGVGMLEQELRVPTRLSAHDHRLDTVTDVLDLRSTLWAPSLSAGTPLSAAQGIVLSEKAATDLHVRVGDTVQVEHPVVTAGGLRLATSTLRVGGLHPNPMRPFTYLDAGRAAELGLAGATNQLTVVPAAGTSRDQLLRALFGRPGVAAVEATSGFQQLVEFRLDQFTGILRVIETATLLLALLIALNTANLTADERAREHATMLAFGLPGRTVTAMAVGENAVMGLVGTLLGLAGGYVALRWVVAGFGSVMPDLSVQPRLFGSTVLTTLVLGVVVVAMAPLLGAGRQRRMDIPSTLRVVE